MIAMIMMMTKQEGTGNIYHQTDGRHQNGLFEIYFQWIEYPLDRLHQNDQGEDEEHKATAIP